MTVAIVTVPGVAMFVTGPPPIVARVVMGGRIGGNAGDNSSFLHTQSTPASEWIVNHNLGRSPASEVRSLAGAVIDADVLHISINQLRVDFTMPVAGTVYCI